MEKPRLEVVVLSDAGPVRPKRLLSALEEDQPASKRLRMTSPICPMEWEPCLPLPLPHRGFVASSLACPPVQAQPLSTQVQKKPPRRARYDPNDFTSDELNPAFEWPRESPSARKSLVPRSPRAAVEGSSYWGVQTGLEEYCDKVANLQVVAGVHLEKTAIFKDGAEVSLLQSIVGQFPLGLRLDKLVTLMWKEHKVHLWKLSVERGYGDILQFLEGVPRIRLSLSKGGSRYLVHMA